MRRADQTLTVDQVHRMRTRGQLHAHELSATSEPLPAAKNLCLGQWVMIGALALILGVSGCSTPPSAWPAGKSPRILASFPPLYCFAKNLVDDDAAVLSLLTATGPHDYHVTPKDALVVQGADLFLINGLGLDDAFTSRLKNSSGNIKLRFIPLGEAIPTKQLRKLTEEDKHDHHGHSHAHGTHDPHVWLGIPEAVVMVERLRDELKKADPARSADYDSRARAYVARLKQLQAEGQELLSKIDPEKRQLITMHDSLYYLARSFGRQHSTEGGRRAGRQPDGQADQAVRGPQCPGHNRGAAIPRKRRPNSQPGGRAQSRPGAQDRPCGYTGNRRRERPERRLV